MISVSSEATKYQVLQIQLCRENKIDVSMSLIN